MRTCTLVAVVMLSASAYGQSPAPLSCQEIVAPSDSGSGRFGYVAPGPGGRLAWFDGQPGQFMLRDAAGKVRRIGRSGAGPGEFDRPGFMGWQGDTIWVGDDRLPRVQFFSDTGQLLRVSTAIMPGGWGPGTGGLLVAFGRMMASMSLPVVVVTHRPGTQRIDTVRSFPVVDVEQFALPLRDQTVPVPQPLAAQTVVGHSADFTRFCGAIPDGSTLRVSCVDPTGRVLLDRQVPLTPRPTPDAVYDSLIAGYLRSPGRTEDMMRSRVKKPRHLPLAYALMVERSGVIWLLRSSRFEPAAVWTRVRPDGSIIGNLLLPRRLRVLLPDGADFFAARPDQDGLETLVRCRIPS